VFGSVAVFCFLVQAFTGILLAFNYAPTPGDAYNSVRYIVTELTGGELIRNLHHWGASMMIIVVVLHMVQVFLWGAYKKPRETTWMIGVVLLLITFAYGLTGYLLPWDNRAYWGTVVTTQIAANAPVLGAYAVRLMGADGGVGNVTFARFFALHVLILPPLTLLLIGIHLLLVRRHGVTPSPGDNLPPKKFYPGQVFKDTAAIFVAFAVLFTISVAVTAPLGQLADPTDSTYIPRPDWYFLFLFEMLKSFEGPLEVFASVFLPAAAVLTLLLVPFIDREKTQRLVQRTFAFGLVVLAAIGWGGLTLGAVLTSPPNAGVSVLAEGPMRWEELPPEALAGIGYYRQENCSSCHSLGESEPGIGPDLSRLAGGRTAAWMIEHFKRPSEMVPGSAMPAIQLSNQQMNALAQFLLNQTPENARALQAAPREAIAGARIYQEKQCGFCHPVNGVGREVGPNLNGLSNRRTREWVVGHFLAPQNYSPGTAMPAYEFSPKEMDQITNYLFALP
jgi:quinol-cytochrome oxidoreductase complex cytochrome b subunit/mono/diheme cytochrome c family protein